MPFDFVLFALTLLGVALFHHRTFEVAVTGLTLIIIYKLLLSPFREGPGFPGLAVHLQHEWVIIANLACVLLGFALLARHFEKSHVPLALPRFLPDGWKGGFALLVIVFVLSSFLDNIAAALIGGAMAHSLFQQSAPRLSRGNRCRRQRRRRRKRRRRYDDHDDVDRGRRAIGRVSRLCGSDRGVPGVRPSCGAAAARIRANPKGFGASPENRLGACRHRRRDADGGHRGERGGQRDIYRTVGPLPVHRRRGLDGPPPLHSAAPTRLGSCSRRPLAARRFSCPWSLPRR